MKKSTELYLETTSRVWSHLMFWKLTGVSVVDDLIGCLLLAYLLCIFFLPWQLEWPQPGRQLYSAESGPGVPSIWSFAFPYVLCSSGQSWHVSYLHGHSQNNGSKRRGYPETSFLFKQVIEHLHAPFPPTVGQSHCKGVWEMWALDGSPHSQCAKKSRMDLVDDYQ